MTGQAITDSAESTSAAGAQVFYRKWRPSSFSELVGQEHVSTTLRQSIRQGRISHSYLFCGPRGSGKTTTARIIAKAANCQDIQDGNPCDACNNCRSVNNGQFMDIIELDAASNRGIDEIRDIRDKVNFAPAQGARKVYIIDEAHMLTDAASNAFLKTLEEPPAHVIFVLCTTEAHKILPTIISRCQRFDFRRIGSELVYGRLADITEAEGVTAEPEALRLVARHAAGSLRDAENLLEQLVVSTSNESGGVTLKQVEELLGLDNGEGSLELVKFLLMANTSASLSAVNRAAWSGTDLRQLHKQVTELLRAAMHLQWGSEDAIDVSEDVAAQLKETISGLPPWRIVRALKTWGDVNMRYDAPSTLPLELAVVEICEDTAPPAAQPAPQASPGRAAAPPPARSAAPPQQPRPHAPNRQAAQRPAARGPEQPTGQRRTAPDPGPISELGTQWLAAVKVLGRHKGKKFNLGALLRDCKANAVSLEDNTLVLGFSNKANLERMQEEMADPGSRRQVNEAVANSFGQAYELRMELANGGGATANTAKTAQQSSLVRTALGMGARVLEEIEE
ncbi:MAG: DNA polymerase III subunit gamma/tau [SAR202 cluster bacterium]|nr:DNA polymerase III subunit gamma/tau [SAR202 cluster bacterium]